MSPLTIVLIVLVIAAIWAVAELALTIRKARSSVEEITRTANETIGQVQPIIDKVDGMVDDLQPAIKDVQPLMDKAGTAVDVATVDMAKLNDILGDVSTVSGTASAVTTSVNKVADSAANGVVNVIGKFTGKRHPAAQPKLEAERRPAERADAPAGQEDTPSEGTGYVTYGGASAGEEKENESAEK